MGRHHPCCLAVSICLSILLALPVGAAGQASPNPPTAGKITNMVPIVNLIHDAHTLPASTSAVVYWGDIVNTGHLARARVALNDGSLLNIGSDTNMTITQHDASSQQTELELNYGRVRAKAVKLVKPNSKFEIRTPTGVAGVVGTDFYLAYELHVTHLLVFEGKVKFCTLDGRCVIVNQGQTSNIRGNESPTQPVPAAQLEAMEVTKSTQIANAAVSGGVVATHGVILATTLIASAVVPAVLVRTLSTTPTCSSPGATAGIRRASTCGVTNAAAPRINGQRP
ncbi:MAG TPA: FecR family protein [Candidatus Acidoferrum sp.]|nr:FecR family protein [Candidatus Acidoferrum sp.]